MGDKLGKDLDEIRKWDAKKVAQPFIANEKLEDIKKNQTPLWIGIAILVISIVTMILATISLFR